MSDFEISSGHVGVYVLLPDQTLHVQAGGESFGSIVGFDAREYVANRGESHGDHVLSGGRLILSSGAVAKDDVIAAGGLLSGPGMIVDDAHSYGVVAGATLQGVKGSSDADVLSDYGRARDLRVMDNASVDVFGASAGDRLLSGGVEHVLSGGVSTGATALVGGSVVLDAHAVAQATTLEAGASEQAHAGAVQRGARVMAGASLLGSESLRGVITDAGVVSGGTVNLGGDLEVMSGGVAEDLRVATRGTLTITAGATAANVSVTARGALVDNGMLTYSGTKTNVIGGTLSGDGAIVEDGPGVLVDSSDGAAFTGSLTISAGTVELNRADSLGSGSIAFEATTGKAALRLEGADRPANGSTFSETLVDFDRSSERLDLRSQAFVAGATASVSGSTLTLKDGSYIAHFDLGGQHASAYVVVKDGAGGTIVRAKANSADVLVQAVAGFDAAHAPASAFAELHGTGSPFASSLAMTAPSRSSHI